MKRYEAEGNVNTHYANCRCPRVTSPETDSQIVSYFKENPFTTASSIAKIYDLSPQTVIHRLRESGLFHHIPAHQTRLTPEQREARIHFCENFEHQDWDQVVFSKKHFDRFQIEKKFMASEE